MYTNYNLWLLITSLILLLAMVGAIVITIKQKKIIDLLMYRLRSIVISNYYIYKMYVI